MPGTVPGIVEFPEGDDDEKEEVEVRAAAMGVEAAREAANEGGDDESINGSETVQQRGVEPRVGMRRHHTESQKYTGTRTRSAWIPSALWVFP